MRRVTKMRAATAASSVAILITATGSEALSETLLERGRYLVTTVGACGNCHSPRDKAGHVISGLVLSGGFEFDDGRIGHVVGSNITPDPETGIGKWTEAQIVTALRDGTRPDGTIIGPPMPIPAYRQLSDQDATAIAAYLKSLKPVRHQVARTSYKVPLPPAYGPPVTHVDEPVRTDKIAYGGYLAGPVGHCVLCHTPPAADGPFDMSRAYQGGRELPDLGNPGAETVSRNITAGSEHGIGDWKDAQIKRAIMSGIRADGTRLARTMPFDWYARMTPADLDAIVAYLRSLPQQKM
jgi:mono/diheme cytochrome c family protein